MLPSWPRSRNQRRPQHPFKDLGRHRAQQDRETSVRDLTGRCRTRTLSRGTVKESASNRDAQIDRVFDDTLPLLQLAFVHYRISGPEAKRFEEGLRVWFGRLVERVKNDQTPVTAFREHLLLAACRFTHGYQAARIRETGLPDERLQRVLAQNPKQVASELQRMLERKEIREEIG